MKHEMSKAMFDRNTKQGILNYLSKFGFDTNRPIDYEPGPTKRTVYAVQDLKPEKLFDIKPPKKPAKKKKKIFIK